MSLTGARGIRRVVEPARFDSQSRDGISDVALMEIRSQKKAPRGPEIASADEKADPAGHGLYLMSCGPNSNRQVKDAPALGTGQLWWAVEQHLLGVTEDFHTWHGRLVPRRSGGPSGLPNVPETMELGMPGHKPGGQGKARKIMFINYVRKPVF
jgi:hypothetical protein